MFDCRQLDRTGESTLHHNNISWLLSGVETGGSSDSINCGPKRLRQHKNKARKYSAYYGKANNKVRERKTLFTKQYR